VGRQPGKPGWRRLQVNVSNQSDGSFISSSPFSMFLRSPSIRRNIAVTAQDTCRETLTSHNATRSTVIVFQREVCDLSAISLSTQVHSEKNELGERRRVLHAISTKHLQKCFVKSFAFFVRDVTPSLTKCLRQKHLRIFRKICWMFYAQDSPCLNTDVSAHRAVSY